MMMFHIGAKLNDDVAQETEWSETKIPRDQNGRIADLLHHKLGEDLDCPYSTFVIKTIYTNKGQEFRKLFTLFCNSRDIHHTFWTYHWEKTCLGIVERFHRML